MTAAHSGRPSGVNKLEASPSTDAASVTHARCSTRVPLHLGHLAAPPAHRRELLRVGRLVQSPSPELGTRPVGLRPSPSTPTEANQPRRGPFYVQQGILHRTRWRAAQRLQRGNWGTLAEFSNASATTRAGPLTGAVPPTVTDRRRRRPPPTTKQPISFPAHAFTPTAPQGAVFTSAGHKSPQRAQSAPRGRFQPELTRAGNISQSSRQRPCVPALHASSRPVRNPPTEQQEKTNAPV